jgi:hypothetical protein
MPNSLDVAKQRKLLEELQRDGQNTLDAERRLRDMLDVITTMHRSNAAGPQRMGQGTRKRFKPRANDELFGTLRP